MEETGMCTKNISTGASKFIKDNGLKIIDDLTSEMVHLDTVSAALNAKHVSLLKEKGYKIRKGAWTKEETTLLKKNFKTYVENNNIDDPLRLLNSKSDRKIKEIIKRTSFHSLVCRNLNRSTRAVYLKLKYQLLCNGKGGRFTEQDDKQLIELAEKQGINFVKIASIMNRRMINVISRHHYIMHVARNKCNKGPWSIEEEKQLSHGLKTVMKTNDIESLRNRFNIKWKEISKYVKTRNFKQCYHHFVHNKKFQFYTSLLKGQPWTKQHTILLINNLYDINCDDESDIDWIELNQLFTDVSPSALYLHQTFARLKCKVDDYNRKSFDEIVETLREKHCNY